jgi:hypothetical protein
MAIAPIIPRTAPPSTSPARESALTSAGTDVRQVSTPIRPAYSRPRSPRPHPIASSCSSISGVTPTSAINAWALGGRWLSAGTARTTTMCTRSTPPRVTRCGPTRRRHARAPILAGTKQPATRANAALAAAIPRSALTSSYDDQPGRCRRNSALRQCRSSGIPEEIVRACSATIRGPTNALPRRLRRSDWTKRDRAGAGGSCPSRA